MRRLHTSTREVSTRKLEKNLCSNKDLAQPKIVTQIYKYIWYHITYLQMFSRKIIMETIKLDLSHRLFLSSLSHFLREVLYLQYLPLEIIGRRKQGRADYTHGHTCLTLFLWSDISLYIGVLTCLWKILFSWSVSMWKLKAKIYIYIFIPYFSKNRQPVGNFIHPSSSQKRSQTLIFSGSSGKEPTCQCRRPKRYRFDSRVGMIPWRRAWQPTPVFLPG